MGVADNKSYKDQYHFKGNTLRVKIEDVPSLEHEPEVNTIIKDNPFRANVEIEKDEVVLKSDLSALFKAKGKTHKGGGIDVLLEPNSFIFSNDKSLAFTPKDHELFEFKKGGEYKPGKCTPAYTLKKNIDIEHYNTLTNNLEDVNKDDIAKRSSLRMLEKYLQTLGNIAYLQEQKKDFPQGLPEFAQGTAPVYDTELKDKIMENKQYVKYGGTILPKAQFGAFTAIPKMIEARKQLEEYIMPHKGYPRRPRNADPDDWYQDPETGRWYMKANVQNSPYSGAPNNPYSGAPNNPDPENPITAAPQVPSGLKPRYTPNIPPGTGLDNLPKVEELDVTEQGVKKAEWRFTPWQKLPHTYNLGKLAGVKRYDPYRSIYRGTYIDPALVNPEQAIGDIKAIGSQQTAALNTLNPILRNAQAQGIAGNQMNAIPGIRSQYDNQNVGIINQFKGINAQERSRANMIQMKNDQDYYQQTVVGRQNFDNMKNFLGDQYMNNLMRDVETNQKLAYTLLTQNQPAYGFDWRTGNFIRNEKNILDVATDTKSDFYTQLAGKLMEKLNSGQQLSRPEVDFFKALSLGKIPFTPQLQKKGGRVNPYRK